MKLLVIIALMLMSFGIGTAWTVKGSKQEWIYVVQSINEVKDWANKQNAPHQEVLAVQYRLDSIQRFLVPQLNSQIDTTRKK